MTLFRVKQSKYPSRAFQQAARCSLFGAAAGGDGPVEEEADEEDADGSAGGDDELNGHMTTSSSLGPSVEC